MSMESKKTGQKFKLNFKIVKKLYGFPPNLIYVKLERNNSVINTYYFMWLITHRNLKSCKIQIHYGKTNVITQDNIHGLKTYKFSSLIEAKKAFNKRVKSKLRKEYSITEFKQSE